MKNPVIRRQFTGGRIGQALFDVDAGWLHPEFKERLERALGLEITKQTGCGSYGCAYLTSNPNMIVKITTDVNEGPAAWAIVSNRFSHPGIVHIHTVFKIDRVEEPAYCLVTERLTPATNIRAVWKELMKHEPDWMGPLATWRDEAMAMVEKQKVLMYSEDFKEVEIFESFQEKPAAELIADLEELYRNFAGYPEIEPMLCGICSLANMYGVIISDVHAGNYGIRVEDEEVEWSTGLDYQPLVLLDVGWASYPRKWGKVPGKDLRNPPLLYPELYRAMPDMRDLL